MRTEQEIKTAIEKVRNNSNLTYSYREDVEYVLAWVLGGDNFDGLDDER